MTSCHIGKSSGCLDLLAQTNSTDTTRGLIEDIQRATLDLFWSGKHWIQTFALYLPGSEGGQGLISIQSKIASFRLKTEQKLLHDCVPSRCDTARWLLRRAAGWTMKNTCSSSNLRAWTWVDWLLTLKRLRACGCLRNICSSTASNPGSDPKSGGGSLCCNVVEILLVRKRVAKSLNNFRLRVMNQISLLHAARREGPERSLQLSKCYWLKYRTERRLPAFTTGINHFFPKQWLPEVWVDHVFPGQWPCDVLFGQ